MLLAPEGIAWGPGQTAWGSCSHLEQGASHCRPVGYRFRDSFDDLLQRDKLRDLIGTPRGLPTALGSLGTSGLGRSYYTPGSPTGSYQRDSQPLTRLQGCALRRLTPTDHSTGTTLRPFET